MNFMLSWQEQYLTSVRSERVRFCSCHLNTKFISSRHRVISFIYFNLILTAVVLMGQCLICPVSVAHGRMYWCRGIITRRISGFTRTFSWREKSLHLASLFAIIGSSWNCFSILDATDAGLQHIYTTSWKQQVLCSVNTHFLGGIRGGGR